MKNFALLLVLPLILAGCMEEDPKPTKVLKNRTQLSIICLNGVKYYHTPSTSGVSAKGGYLTPYVSAKTLQFEACDPQKSIY